MKTASDTLHQELAHMREALQSGVHLERAPREQRQRRALAGRVFLLALQLHWRTRSGPCVKGPTSSPLPPLAAR